MTTRKSATLLVALILSTGAVLSGCAEEAKPDGATAIPAAKPTEEAADGCGDAPAKVKKHLNDSAVESVIIEGQCTSIVVATKLADEDVATARKLCDTAGEVAYTGDINSVSVLSASGEELSNGITGMKCLP
ncbi:hypothetical protein [Actinoplanes sp. NPDC049599]|uniref:hypothetical protein n=1 Tax=Actinoplanes sp. NPDC049599 TaxID=3363903 RepID=UPI00378887CE